MWSCIVVECVQVVEVIWGNSRSRAKTSTTACKDPRLFKKPETHLKFSSVTNQMSTRPTPPCKLVLSHLESSIWGFLPPPSMVLALAPTWRSQLVWWLDILLMRNIPVMRIYAKPRGPSKEAEGSGGSTNTSISAEEWVSHLGGKFTNNVGERRARALLNWNPRPNMLSLRSFA